MTEDKREGEREREREREKKQSNRWEFAAAQSGI